MNLEQAKRASIKGAYVAFLLGGLGIILFTYFIFFANDSNPNSLGKLYGNPINYLCALLYFLLGFKLLKFSRIAAAILLLLIIVGIVIVPKTSTNALGILFFLFVAYYFGNALRGTIIYHKIQSKEDPDYRKTPKWQYYLGIPFGLFIFSAAVYGFLIETGRAPATEVLTGSQLKNKSREILRQNGILLKNERIDFFFSSGFLSILDEGNILTDQRVITYETVDEELIAYSIHLDKITKVELVEKGNLFEYTTINVFSGEEDGIILWLSTENNGDEKFIEALSQRIQSKNQKENSPTNKNNSKS